MFKDAAELFRRLLLYLKPNRRLAYVGIVCAFLFVWIDIAMAFYIQNIIDSGVSEQYRGLLFWTISAAFTIGVGFYLNKLSINSSGKLAAFVLESIRNQIVRFLPELPLHFVEQRKNGEMVSRLTNAEQALQEFLKEQVPTFIHQYTRAIICIVILSMISLKLLLASLVVVPIAFYISKKLGQMIGHYMMRAHENVGIADSVMHESIHGSEVVKAYQLSETQSSKYNLFLNESILYFLKALRIESSIIPAGIFLGIAPLLVCSVYGGFLAYQGEMSLGQLMAFIQMQNYVNETLSAMPGLTGNIRKTVGASKYLFELLEEPTELEGELQSIHEIKGPIVFQDISFSYNDQPLLQDINFEMEAGKVVAVVGASGSGKSTLVKLICGFYGSTNGKISIAGQSINDYDVRQWRRNISVVAQDPFLFPATIKENICCFEPLDKEKLHQSANMADLHLPGGLNSFAGEKGSLLSGGQRQKVSIARALYKDAPILLLDEATSALDIDSERRIMENLIVNNSDKYVLIVTHRLSTIEIADVILVMENGQIVQRGTHEELVREEGVYRQLYKHQAGLEGESIRERRI